MEQVPDDSEGHGGVGLRAALALVPPEALWLTAGGLAAACGLVLAEPGAGSVGYGAALSMILAISGAPLRGWDRPWLWPGLLALATGLAGLGVWWWGGAVMVAVSLLQVAAGLAASSRGRALAGAGLVGGVAIVTAWSSGQLGSWVIAPVVGLALAGAVAQLLDALAGLERRVVEPPAPHMGATWIQVDQLQRDLAEAMSQLQREARQRRQAEEQALAALRTKTAFLSVMSHELRTPLNQIIGYSELLLEEISEGAAEDAADDLQRIHTASLNLLEMVTNVLEMAKIESGTMAVVVEEVEVEELVENVVRSVAGQAHQRGNVIRVRCPAGLPALRSDRTKLRTVLANLLSNACKFTRDGTIRVAASAMQQAGVPWLLIEVSDTGIGIRPEEIDRLFAAFVQADGSTTRRHDGSGLGLALAHHFCALLGGEISVESTPGEGSKFRVRVPCEFVDPRRAGHVLTSMAAPR